MDRRNDCWVARAKICFFEELEKEDQIFATNALNCVPLQQGVKEVKHEKEVVVSREQSPTPRASPATQLDDSYAMDAEFSLDYKGEDSFQNEAPIIDNDVDDEETEDEDDDMDQKDANQGSQIERQFRYGHRKLGDLASLPAFDAHHDTGDEHDLAARVKNVNLIRLGVFEMEPWYFSPIPSEYQNSKVLHFCEFCLNLFAQESELRRHARRCNVRHPPGNEIYRSVERTGSIAVFEVDGRIEATYCQNLCYLAKLFLDHKFVRYDTFDFLFYILTEYDDNGYHIVAYFSKEKACRDVYLNLACILCLPCHQQKGYGTFLISLSYELSKLEKKIGQPEGPISDLGRRSYESYWKLALHTAISNLPRERKTISVEELSKLTSIRTQDIRATLEEQTHLIRFYGNEWIIDMSKATARRIFESKVSKFCFVLTYDRRVLLKKLCVIPPNCIGSHLY